MQRAKSFPFAADAPQLRYSMTKLRKAGQPLAVPKNLKLDEATGQRLLAITDLGRLDRLADRVLEVSTWEELLATP